MVFPEVKSDPRVSYLDYTWLISGILYEGGTDKLIPELMKRDINEDHFLLQEKPSHEPTYLVKMEGGT